MKTVGIICEYNPFHNGHLHHLIKAKEIAEGGAIIAILTGYFSMRGDISVINKYDKIKTAIDNGVNLTIELPYLLGTQNADLFAYNSIYLLNKMKIDTIVCGSEQNNLNIIKEIYQLQKKEEFQDLIKMNLKNGNSYRKSFSEALKKYNYELNSNDMLNLKYYEAIQNINPQIELILIQRINNNYNDKTINNSKIQSATALRIIDTIEGFVPEYVNEIFINKGFYNINQFSSILRHIITTSNINDIFMAKEGIENSLTANFQNIDELVEKLTTKRYTSSRIKRFLSYIITNTQKDTNFDISKTLPRVTGFDELGKGHLSKIKKQVNYFTRLTNGISEIYDKELLIAKIFTNIFNEDFIKIEQQLPYKK